jgi:hypothetical protein
MMRVYSTKSCPLSSAQNLDAHFAIGGLQGYYNRRTLS